MQARAFLIADVRGYTRFTRERGDAAAARLATWFADIVRDAVAARSGEVIELRGDEALAVFVDEGQAVRAAIELQATLAEEASADASLPLHVGVGIDAGEAVPVGDGYRGAALNMAARLCSRAAGGQVLVSATVCDRVGECELASFVSNGRAELKGFGEVEVFEAVSRIARLERTRRGASAATLPAALALDQPLVGRESELAWLRGVWRAARRGAGRVAVVSGGDGMGKTALAAAFARVVGGEGHEVIYAGAGGAALARVRGACRRAAEARLPVLVVLDDMEVTRSEGARALAGALAQVVSAPALLLVLTDDPDVVPELATIVDRVDQRGDGHRQLQPLGYAAVAQLAAMYAGDDVAQVPVDSILQASGGRPAVVHELLDRWAREEAARRLEAAAQWLAAGRERHRADLAFAHNAIERRLERLYSTEPADEPLAECPYKGLAAFTEEDADRFFGRERLVGELAARTVATGLLALVGPSGSGKSSLMLAGLLPSLRAGVLPGSARWALRNFRPGPHPLDELPSAAIEAASPDHRLVLAVDQFEELFTLCEVEDERSAFVERLVDAAGDPERVVVVLAVRGDYLDHIAAYPALAELVSANQVLVGPMTSDDYRRAIEQPARRAGLRVESALSEALVEQAGHQPGALPLLSTALVELWANRTDDWLRLDSFTATGGLRGAVARLAETCYQQLDERQRRAARRVFLRLAGTGEGSTLTRARVPVADFDVEEDPVTAGVIDRFVRDRLLTRDEGSVEVAHEALLREWPRLTAWIEEEGQGRLLHAHLAGAARAWDANGRRAADLYRAERLSAALAWSGERGEQLNALERAFLVASQGESTRSIRRLRLLALGLALLLAAAVVAGVVALVQRRDAQSAAQRARLQATVAIAERAGVEGQDSPNLTTGLLLASAAERLHPSAQTDASLLRLLIRAGHAERIYHLPTRALGVVPDPDGLSVAVEENNGGVVVYNAATGRITRRLPDTNGMPPVGVAYSPNGHLLAEFTQANAPRVAGLIVLRDASTGRIVGRAWDPRPHANVISAAFSPNGRRIFAISGQTVGLRPATHVRLVEWRTGDVRAETRSRRLPGTPQLAVDATGDPVTIAGGVVTVWNAATLRPTRSYAAPHAATASGDGRLLVETTNRWIQLRDLPTGRLITTLKRPRGFQPSAVTADRRILVGRLGRTRVAALDTASGAVTTLGRETAVSAPVLAPDSLSVYTSSASDKAAVRWGIASGVFAHSFPVAPAGRGGLVVSAANHVAATLGTVHGAPAGRLWDISTGHPLGKPLTLPGHIGWLTVSPNGRTAAATDYTSGEVTIWNVATGAVLKRLPAPGVKSGAAWITYSPNGRLIAISTEVPAGPDRYRHGWTYVWDMTTGRLLHRLHQPRDQGVSSARFSDDSTRIVSVGDGGTVAVWDVSTGRRITSWATTDAYTIMAVFAPHHLLATAGLGGGLVSLWDSRSGHHAGQPIASAGTLYPVDFYDQGRRLVVAQGNPLPGAVQLWDVPNRRLVGTLPIGGKLPGAAVTPDGHTLITTSTDGLLTRWPLSPSTWAADACALAGTRLTQTEWRTFLAGLPYQHTC